ncbi:hypothetical protein BDF20DRAFT_801870, partial [Mycotypha africana]|uniref:uncharacterized protein n=1 Tax=Mycotypha africana TaxID=64632 RepID=UPI002301C8BC
NYFLSILCSVFAGSYVVRSLWKALVVPKHLRHIPKVNSLRWFWSIMIGESHDVRIKKLMLPLIAEHGLCLK